MNSVHLHLITTHAPATLVIVGTLLLLAGLIRGSEDLKRSAFVTFVVAALLAVIAYVTGEPATQHLKGVVGTMRLDEIDRHAEIAVVALTLVVVHGLFAFAILIWRRNKPLGRGVCIAALVFAFIVAVMLAWTSQLGGYIRHPEAASNSREVVERHNFV